MLLVNENGSDNIGDHAINEGLSTLLDQKGFTYDSAPFLKKRIIKDVDIVAKQKTGVFATFKQLIMSIKVVYIFVWVFENKTRIKTLLNNDYDGVIIGGGQLILSGFAFPIAMYSWVKYAKHIGLPVYVAGVGCGESFLPIEVRLYKKALRQCNKVFVRDEASVIKLKQLFNIQSHCYPDFAFGLDALIKPKKYRSGIVAGMTDYEVFLRYKHEVDTPDCSNYQIYLMEWVERVISLLINNTEVVYLASTTIKDAECNIDLYQLLGERVENPIQLIDGVSSLIEYRELLADSRLIISGRMHSLILGKIENCQIEPWVISEKVNEFLTSYIDSNTGELKRMLNKFLESLDFK